MLQANHLAGSIYHMVHFDNLGSIFQEGMLFSKEMLGQKRIVHRSIAYESVQDLRDRIFIWDFFEQKYRSLHRYVPFYFATHPPMLHVQRRDNIQSQVVILKVSRALLEDQGVLFTDGNATNQQLSQNGREQVGIVPATTISGPCRREYRPTGPHGTSQSLSNFYGDIIFLDNLDWDGINNRRYIASWEEYKRVRSAEVLIPDSLPLEKIQEIAVNTGEMVQAVNTLIQRYRSTGFVPSVILRPQLFLK